MDIKEKLKTAGIKFEEVEEKREVNFKLEDLKDANFDEFEDNQLRAAYLLSSKYMQQEQPPHFTKEEWAKIHDRVKAAMDKKNMSHGE